jgi:hypothetical protein
VGLGTIIQRVELRAQGLEHMRQGPGMTVEVTK